MSDWADDLAALLNDHITFGSSIETVAACLRRHVEPIGLREQYEEASRQLDILRREVDAADLALREIDEIQIMLGCDHIEGLAGCLRAKLEGNL